MAAAGTAAALLLLLLLFFLLPVVVAAVVLVVVVVVLFKSFHSCCCLIFFGSCHIRKDIVFYSSYSDFFFSCFYCCFTMGKWTSNDQRVRLRALVLDANWTISQAARHLNIRRQTASDIMNKGTSTPASPDKKRGRPPVCTERDRGTILRTQKADRYATYVNVKNSTSVQCSVRSIESSTTPELNASEKSRRAHSRQHTVQNASSGAKTTGILQQAGGRKTFTYLSTPKHLPKIKSKKTANLKLKDG